jgi:hypothetical protein
MRRRGNILSPKVKSKADRELGQAPADFPGLRLGPVLFFPPDGGDHGPRVTTPSVIERHEFRPTANILSPMRIIKASRVAGHG